MKKALIALVIVLFVAGAIVAVVQISRDRAPSTEPASNTAANPPSAQDVPPSTDNSTADPQAAGPAEMENVLSLWSAGKKDDAINAFERIDWKLPADLPKDSFFMITEQQLSPDNLAVNAENVKKLQSVRELARELLSRAQTPEMRGKVRSLGEFLSADPNGLLIRKQAGKAMIDFANRAATQR